VILLFESCSCEGREFNCPLKFPAPQRAQLLPEVNTVQSHA
jgi:hypothetical protein